MVASVILIITFLVILASKMLTNEETQSFEK
jgi:hypothetical protein